MEAKKIKDATNQELEQLIRGCFLLVGLRTQYIPNELETIFLFQFIKDNYSQFTLEDIKLAFTKVAKGDFGDDCKLFDYFSPAYFGTVMKKYKDWASETANKIADMKYTEQLKKNDIEKQKQLGTTSDLDWRELIESDYQNFLRGVDTSKTYPVAYYDILVKDGCIAENFWEKKFNYSKQKIINDLQKELAVIETTDLTNPNKQMRYNKLKEDIHQYKSGDRNSDIILYAKQRVVAVFFKYNAELENKNLYQKQE